jgi:hypothetical protein
LTCIFRAAVCGAVGYGEVKTMRRPGAAGEPLGAGVRRARDKAANKEAAAAAKSAFRSREWVIMGAGPV